MAIKIGESYDNFRKIREKGFYYVDKTILLKEYLGNDFKPMVLFARPRKFGKTVTMTMIRDFLDIRQDSKAIFEGLEIMEYPGIVKDYMNQYPVVYVSFKEVQGIDYEEVLQSLRVAVSRACEGYSYLLDHPTISDSSKRFFKRLLDREAFKPDTLQALDLLCQMLMQAYGKPVFVIVDEYDVPMAKTLGKPFYDDVRDMMELMLSYVCKTNDNVEAVILSGCLYTVRNSSFTSVNNIISYSVLSPNYASMIGFTDDDVQKLLRDACLEDRLETVREWYDGYLFGRERVYCPWDVLRYVSSVLRGAYDEERGLESHWVNTSDVSASLIHGFLGRTTGATEGFERLLAGETIDCLVDENLSYDRIHEIGDNLWSALLETGYLTKAVMGRPMMMPLRIPNNSIRAAFQNEVMEFFRDRVDNAYVFDLVSALWAQETKRAQDSLNQILEAMLSFYHEYHEYSYHLILDGFFTGRGYQVLSEIETGYGRSDLIILDRVRSRSMVLELKHVKEEKEMEAALKEASSQIIRKKYGSRLKYEGYTKRLQYGMAFYDKQSLVAIIEPEASATKKRRKATGTKKKAQAKTTDTPGND